MLQGLFPSIKLGQCNLKLMKRVVLASKDSETGVIAIRHYKINQRDLQISDPLRMIDKGQIPNLGQYESIEDYFMENLKAQSNNKKQQRAINLQEIGPRIDLSFKQVQTNVFGGNILNNTNDEPKQKTYKYKTPKKKNE